MSKKAILLLGATGYTGQLTLKRLLAAGLSVTAAGRRQDRLEKLKKSTEHSFESALFDIGDAKGLLDLVSEHQVVINTVGPFLLWGRPVVDACVEAGCAYLDCTGEQGFMVDVYKACHEKAQEKGSIIVNAMAFEYALGDALCARLSAEQGPLDTIELLYRFDSPFTSRGTYLSMLAQREVPGLAYEGGKHVPREVGSALKRFHFPGQAKRSRGVWIPFGESVMVPRHCDVQGVLTYMTLPKGGGDLSHMKQQEKQEDGTPFGPDAGARAQGSFGIAALHGESQGLILEGRDPYGVTADLLTFGAKVLLEGQGLKRGVVTPSEAFGWQAILSRLTMDWGFRIENLLSSQA